MRSSAQIKSHPIHPMLVSFPIGLWVASFFFDVFGVLRGDPALWSAGFYMEIAGCVGALLAAVPGAMDYFLSIPPSSSAKKRGAIHGILNLTVLVLFVIAAIHRGNSTTQPDKLVFLLAGISVVLLGFSGWLGGTLVYRNQIAVDHRYANGGKWKQRALASYDKPVCNQGELAQGQMMLANIAGDRIVVAHCDQGMVAFSDRCTHKGGSLSDGALVGCRVQCPWHGSQFDVMTGRVVAGPAEHKIELYGIEVRGGEVYVLPKSGQRNAA